MRPLGMKAFNPALMQRARALLTTDRASLGTLGYSPRLRLRDRNRIIVYKVLVFDQTYVEAGKGSLSPEGVRQVVAKFLRDVAKREQIPMKILAQPTGDQNDPA